MVNYKYRYIIGFLGIRSVGPQQLIQHPNVSIEYTNYS